MITASEFLEWLSVFNVAYGGNTLTVPVALSKGGTGAALTASNGGLLYSTASAAAILATSANGVLRTDAGGLPSISTTLPSGLTIPGYLPLAGGTMSGALQLSGMPLTSSAAANKQYVDDVAAGLTPTGPVQAATTTNLVATYNNGAAGVGATLTMNATGTVTFDGILTLVGKDYLIKDQSTLAQNGLYTCTVAGAVGVAGVFTRSTSFNTPAQINAAGITPVLLGTTQANQGWYEINDVTTIGTDPIVFIRFGNTGTVTSITAGTGLTGGTISSSGTIALSVPVLVNLGGSGVTSTTAYGLIAGGTTSTGAFQNIGAGTSGYLVQSNGASALPGYTTTPSVQQISWTDYTKGILGTTTNDNAGAGYVGEFGGANVSPTAVAMTPSTPVSLVGLALAAGDYLAYGTITLSIDPPPGLTFNWVGAGISTINNALPSLGYYFLQSVVNYTGVAPTYVLPTRRIKLAVPTTIYAVGIASFSGGAMAGGGILEVDRLR